MDRIKVIGGNPLKGRIRISGAKNAVLPLMIASLLTEGTLILENVPDLADIDQLIRILGNHGMDHSVNGRRHSQEGAYSRKISFSAHNIVSLIAPYSLVSRMRASFWVIGPLLARMREARVSLPGGCAIGTRPVDLFMQGLQALGATIDMEEGYVVAKAPGGLKGNRYRFNKVSVGATHVLMMAATLAKGETLLENAAREPEVINLAECLTAMGARITGAGTSNIHIQGVDSLSGAHHHVIPDRIEAGTYALAVALAGGDVLLENVQHDLLPRVLETISMTGAEITKLDSGIRIKAHEKDIRPVSIKTEPFPGFPTDLQAQFMSLMCHSKGKSSITETIFENRFMHVQELARLGADISLSGQTATVKGVSRLQGAEVMATDLRASVSLIIAGLAAKGETIINRVYHLDRGFEHLEHKLSACGAQIERLRS